VDPNALPDIDSPLLIEALREEPLQEIRNIYDNTTDSMIELKPNP
jgi:hypothetical protein